MRDIVIFSLALRLSSRRGRLVEAIRHWLVRRGLWSSARARVVEAPPGPLTLAARHLRFLLLLVCAPYRLLSQRPGRPCAATPR